MKSGAAGTDCLEGACVGRVGQATCGAVGFALAAVALAVAYSTVVAVVSVVPLLSTTAIVFVGLFAWLGAWFVLSVLVEVTLRRGVRTSNVGPR